MKNNIFEWTEEKIEKILKKQTIKKLNNSDRLGDTALTYLCGGGDINESEEEEQLRNNKILLIEKILEYPIIDINKTDQYRNTPLILSCLYLPEVTEKILNTKKAEINKQSENGQTALMAACYNHPNLIKLLIKQTDIDINIKTPYGVDAFEFAKKSGNYYILKNTLEFNKIKTDLNINRDIKRKRKVL